MALYLDIHVLQTVPPSNINRDDSGSPKTAVYGGVRRARVSSQAWKRAVRKAFEADPATAPEAGRRTRLLPQVIGDRLAQRVPMLAEYKDQIGLAAAKAVFNIKAAKKGATTEYLLFLGEAQVDAIVDALASCAEALAAAGGDEKALNDVLQPLDLRSIGVKGHPGAVALFGRMVADAPDVNVDAACQVAHAISTHQVETQFDYYTAVDDLQSEENSGAGMIGTVEFNSATLYRYATVEMGALIKNLDGEVERALDLSVAFVKAFVTSIPTGKQNTFAHQTRPDLVLVAVRDDQPVNLVGAFERPVFAPRGGLMTESVLALARYWHEQEEMYGTRPVFAAAAYPERLAAELREDKMGDVLPERQPLPALLTAVREHLTAALLAAVGSQR